MQLTPRQLEGRDVLRGPQRHTAFVGGARSGKTFLLTRATCIRALRVERSKHAILRFRANAARSSISLDTLPKVMHLCFPGTKLKEHRQDGFWEMPNKSQLWVAGLDEKDRVEKILGQEFSTMYFNETSQIPYASILVALTRLAENVGLKQRALYDLNPTTKGHWTNALFGDKKDPVSKQPLAKPEDYVRFFINPNDNRANLTPEFLESLANLPARQRKRFYEGVYGEDVDGALWSIEVLERNRAETVALEQLRRVVVAVDPSGAASGSDDGRDEIGITVSGIDAAGRGYVLADFSLRAGPAEWGKVVANAFHKFKADRVVAEQNFGGEMVRFVIQTADKNIPVEVITASRGKAVRADPVSALYEKDRVSHAVQVTDGGHVIHTADFSALEDQMCAFSQSGYGGEDSPDRADSLVWGLTHLMLQVQDGAGLYEFYSQQAAKANIKPPVKYGYELDMDALTPLKDGQKLLAPPGFSNISGRDGRSYIIGADGTVFVHEKDVTALLGIGFQRAA